MDQSGAIRADLSMPDLIGRVCEESCERMQLVADLLLLKSGKHSSPTTKTLSVLEPVSTGNESYGKLRDTIVANTKALAISIKDFGKEMNLQNLRNTQELAIKVTNQAILLTETAAHAAYYSSLSDIGCKPAKPGVIDNYKFQRARQELQLSYEKFKPEYCTLSSSEQIVNISKTIAESLAVLTHGCAEASKNDKVSSGDRIQFANCSQSLQSATVTFVTALKAFATSHTNENCKKCLLFGKPLLATVDSIVEFSSFPQFSGEPAILTQKGHESQIDILGGSMAVISSSIQLLGTAKAILCGGEHDTKLRASQWQKLANCIKAVGDATKLLSSAIREHTPMPSRRPSADYCS